jgi:hypothetical protein
MQWLRLVWEDAGLQRLKAANGKPPTAPVVDALSPYPATHPVQLGERRQTRQEPAQERRRQERRVGDRRREQQAILIDTRSKHDRRALVNRRQGDEQQDDQPPARTRLNLYA